MIGQSIINVKSGGRGRLSTFAAGTFLLILIVFLGDWLKQIPMAALVAVMVMVSIGTFSWSSITDLKRHPLSTNIVMVTTVIVVVATHNLAIGVFVGVLLATLFFANKISRFMVVKSKTDCVTSALVGSEEGTKEGRKESIRTYEVAGQVFFASAEKFINSFDFKEVVDRVVIDLTHAHFWDITSVSSLDKVVIKFKREGTDVEIIGMGKATETIVDKFGVHNDPIEVEKLMAGH